MTKQMPLFAENCGTGILVTTKLQGNNSPEYRPQSL